MHRNNCGGRETTPVHLIESLFGYLCHAYELNNNFYELFRCCCGRATLTLLSAVMLSDCSMKFRPKCTCLREQPAPHPSTPLARSHLCSTDRQVQRAFCIPSLFRVNFFYLRKYRLQRENTIYKFLLSMALNKNLHYKAKTCSSIHIILPRSKKHIGKHPHVLSV